MKFRTNNRRIALLTMLLITVFTTSLCSYKTKKEILNQKSNVKYRTSYPDLNASANLERILTSVKKIKNYSSYRTYVFDEKTRVTLKDLSEDGLLQRTRAGIVTNDATAGTALIIYSDGKNIALLTCAHAVKAPDTIIQWADYSDLGNNRFINSISIKIKQQLYVNDLTGGSRFRVLASDSKNDIAIIGSSYNEPVNDIPVFNQTCGNSSDLKWGSFLYLLGFPTGQQMVSHGIVSTFPEKEGNFLTDAPFNEGLSGGIAIAVTEDGGNFELVGIARSVAASYGYVIKPEKEIHEFTYNPAIPYSGNTYVNQKKDINYGVTSVISINQVRKFYEQNRTDLLRQGFNLDEFFGMNPKSK